MKFRINISFIFLLLLGFVSCKNSQDNTETNTAPEKETNIVQLSDEQFKVAGISTGKVEPRKLSGIIKANGLLDVPPQNLVSVSAPMPGFVKSTDLLQGMKVNKGQLLVTLQNPEYIQLQQDYADYKSQLEYLEEEYKRQQELSKENINSQKTMLQAKTQYQSMLAKVNGLKAKLNLLGLNPEQVSSGNFQSTVNIYSPINGYVTEVNINLGMHVDPATVMFKITDTEHLHAELSIFERDVHKIKIGQKVRFTLANENKERTASVYLIGREIGKDRTVRIHCHLDVEDNSLLPGMYIKAYIEAGEEAVSALPSEAVVNYEGKDYVFIPEKGQSHTFKMVEVEKGLEESGYTEVTLPQGLNSNSEIVIKGAYDLLSKLKNSEEE